MSAAIAKINAVNSEPPIEREQLPQELMYSVERHLIREARILDEERIRYWYENFLTEDIMYSMPIQVSRYRREKGNPLPGSNPGSGAYMDNYELLGMRIARLETGLVWMEDPQNAIRRFLTNIDAEYAEDGSGDVIAYCNFMVYRNRRQRDETVTYGHKVDRLRQVDGKWRCSQRTIHMDQRVILDKNVTFFL